MSMWTIMEEGRDDYGRGFGMRDGGSEAEMAYREGCRHGYRKAMEEMQGGMGFREGGYSGGTSRMGERFDYPSYPDMGEMGERRRRDYRGRYM